MNLSKSKFTRYLQCPKMLWLDTYKRELAKEDPALLRRFAEGNEVGDLAMGLMGDYVETTAYTEDGRLDIAAMLKNTGKYLSQGVENICEAAFSKNNCYCAVDILHKMEKGYDIVEVKSSTEIKDVYLADCSYQKWVLTSAGLNIGRVFIAYINNRYVRNGEVNIHELFKVEDVTDRLAPYENKVGETTREALSYLTQKEEPPMCVGKHCSDPYPCVYHDYCFRTLPKPNVFDLYRMSAGKAEEYYQSGIVSLEDALTCRIPLNAMQRRQAEFETFDLPTHIDKPGIRAFLETLTYPLYFLDFETFQTCVPLYDGIRPYQQVPFQYSLHYFLEKDGELCHSEFLADEDGAPRRALAEQLVSDIPQDACVLAYNKAFECTRLKELAAAFPDLAEHLLKIEGNIRDLLDVFRDGFVYDRAMGGSLSIKSVLPALFPNSPELDYHNLEDVHNGTEATAAFLSLRGMEKGEREKLRASLLAYCKLDTMAMVLLWQRLKEFCI